jgi:hypothetical protein
LKSVERMKMTFTRYLLAALPLLLVGSLGGAVVSCDAADRLFDCQSVCNRYKDCYDSKYDVGTCRGRCRDKAAMDAAFEQKASSCENCMDDKSCAETTFKCATECLGVVPQ